MKKNNINHYEIVDSTNNEAIRHINSNSKTNWILADRQISGKGRGDNKWESPFGGLYCSHILRDDNINHNHISQISIISSLIVLKTIIFFLNDSEVKAKWPNDILCNNKKISGILINTLYKNDKMNIIIGIGINVLSQSLTKSNAQYSFMDTYNDKINVLDVFHKLIEEFNNIITKWDYGKNFNGLRDNWMKYAYKLGQEITVKHNDEFIEGLFSNIDETGNLILKLNNKILRFNTGEVF
tara:strand:- start:425 stop:1144 length:720 start_codon:yes stop_codon:yes gene_type:complete